MSTLVEDLTQKGKLLLPEERVRLAEELLATVQEADSEVEAAWGEEIRRRLAEIENGTAKLIFAEEVFAVKPVRSEKPGYWRARGSDRQPAIERRPKGGASGRR